MIVLSTLNARYMHASFGLRYLRANLGAHREKAVIREFVIKRDPSEIADEILKLNPKLVGFGVYIWNTDQTLEVVKALREKKTDLLIVAGGPEISYETEEQPLFHLVDFVFKGESDFTFRDFVADWMEKGELPSQKVIGPKLPEIKEIRLPYDEYTDEDIKNRVIYVEASRGCPYKCEYCLSSLDVSVRNFDTENFLVEIQKLIDRGARQFKFVDRTFNLSPSTSGRILQFFLDRIHLGLFLHFEMVPDRLPDELKALIKKFPAGSLQFEIGVQTWNPEVAKNVSRRQNYEKIRENFRFLKSETGVHTHADLIVGLPGETVESFAHGFNELASLEPDEIQVGILKRLKGTPIVRHDRVFQMRYSDKAPFQILENKDMSAAQIRQLEIFADFWDLVANSGRFPDYMSELRMRSAERGLFAEFFDLSQSLHKHFGRTHSIHLKDLGEALGASFTLPVSTLPSIPSRQNFHLQLS
jgi:radical SAM superfamily enzyme YgiQ (UPF0313 family)